MPRNASQSNCSRSICRIADDDSAVGHVEIDLSASSVVKSDLEADLLDWTDSCCDLPHAADATVASGRFPEQAAEAVFGDDAEWVILRPDHWHQ